MEYASGGITQIGDGSTLDGVIVLGGPNTYMELSGATGSNSALTGLKVIVSNGGIQLGGGSLSTTSNPTNNGELVVGGGSALDRWRQPGNQRLR